MSDEPEKKATLDLTRGVVPAGSLLTLLAATVGGSMYATDIRAELVNLAEDVGDVKTELRSIREAFSGQATTIQVMDERHRTLQDRVTKLREEFEEQKDRLQALELAVRQK